MGCSSARYAQMKCVCVMYVCHICTLQIALVVTREESRWYCHIYGFLRAFIFFTIRVEKKIIFRFCSFHADAAKIIIRDSTECVADVGCEDNKSMHKGHKITGFSSIVRRWQCCLFVSVWCEWQNVLNGWANGQMNDVLVVPSDSEVIYLSCGGHEVMCQVKPDCRDVVTTIARYFHLQFRNSCVSWMWLIFHIQKKITKTEYWKSTIKNVPTHSFSVEHFISFRFWGATRAYH